MRVKAAFDVLRCSGSWISMVQDIPARGAISTLLCELVHERLLWTSEDFVWLLIPLFMAEQTSSIWPNDRMLRSSASESILRCLSLMLHESIDADVTINTGEGASKSHKAIL
ncbi:hypothetical protein Tco_0368098 [Tanacetum coccineum]